jgi:hypothetical protein
MEDAPVQALKNPHDYAGGVSDVAFELGDGVVPASRLAELVRAYVGPGSRAEELRHVMVAEPGHLGGMLCDLDPSGEWIVVIGAW